MIIVFLTLSTYLNGQEKQYNLPPGYKIVPNYIPINFSYKLEGIKSEKNYTSESLVILKVLTEEELENAPQAYQNYVYKGRKYIESLSEKVKSIYTESEIWYIYAFDKELKNRIKKIK